MKKFKKNEKVRVARNPQYPNKTPTFADEMGKYKGKIVTLASDIDGSGFCKIKEDGGSFTWAERWFEKVAANIIEIDESKITLFRNNGKIFIPEHRVSIVDFVNKMKSRTVKKSDMSTPLLPSNTKYYARDKEAEVYVIEQSPQTRIVQWPFVSENKKNIATQYNLAFPYVFFVCVFVSNKLIMIEGETPKCYYRSAQITLPEDVLFHTNLMNVSSKTSGIFLSACQNNQKGVQEQIEEMISNFWNNAPKNNPDDSRDFYFSAKIAASLASVEAWQKESSLNPLFPLKLPWLKNGNTVQSVTLESLHKFSGLEIDQEKIQHVKQLAEIVKELPKV
jgi:hypothetical protein